MKSCPSPCCIITYPVSYTHLDVYKRQDIAYVEICLTDEAGNLNPEVDKAVSISAEGPGTILGYGSADPDSEENYFDTTAKAFEGRLRAAVRGTGQAGTITITLQTEGCEMVTVELKAV